jgi:uncharacterized protein (TIGR03083 family)
MITGDSIGTVLTAMRAERLALVELLGTFGDETWALPTECPAYSVKGIATHVLGDDLSLLSRQRDAAANGLVLLAGDMPGADFRTLLDTFNDRWVAAASFLSPAIVVELLRIAGEWAAEYYEAVDPHQPGEPVGFFGGFGASSPMWHAIAREYVERWVHHSQIRRAADLGSLCDEPFLLAGAEVVATVAGVEVTAPASPDGEWQLGTITLGPAPQAADILTRAHTSEEIPALVSGPADAVQLLARFAGRP